MTWDVIYSDESIRDLEELYAYVALDLRAPQAARRLIERMVARADSLETFPLRFPLYPASPLRERSVRYIVFDNYLILYHPDEADHSVSILRIIYGRSDVIARFNKENQEKPLNQSSEFFSETSAQPRIGDDADIPRAILEDGRLIVPTEWRDEDDD